MVASLTFLTPRGGLLGLVALIPLAALAISTLRVERIARALGLPRARRRQAPISAILAVAAVRSSGSRRLSRPGAAPSAIAPGRRRRSSSSSTSRARWQPPAVSRRPRAWPGRARRHPAARRRADGAGGLAGLTDRVLPYLFPTLDEHAFQETLARSVHIESPPPQQVSTNATSFEALTSLARDGFFTRGAARRTCVLVTDGESRSYSAADVVGALQGARGCRLLVVRVGGSDERVFGADGLRGGYTADPAAADRTRALAEAAGGQAFSEADVPAAAAAVRRAAEVGPTGRQQTSATNRALAPYAAALALAAVLALDVLRLREPGLHRILTKA